MVEASGVDSAASLLAESSHSHDRAPHRRAVRIHDLRPGVSRTVRETYTRDLKTGGLRFHRAPPPTTEDVEALVVRIAEKSERLLADRDGAELHRTAAIAQPAVHAEHALQEVGPSWLVVRLDGGDGGPPVQTTPNA